MVTGRLTDNRKPIAKRRVALLRSMGKTPEAIASLIWLLEFSPTDAEAWAELADLYLSQGLYSQAIHALEEVLVVTPNAWNVRGAGFIFERIPVNRQCLDSRPPRRGFIDGSERFDRDISPKAPSRVSETFLPKH